jgi:hypothetical protein
MWATLNVTQNSCGLSLSEFNHWFRDTTLYITSDIAHIQEHVLPLYDLTMLNSERLHSHKLCTTSDHFKVAHIQEHVLPLHDLTMLNSERLNSTHTSSVQHQITLRQPIFKNMYYVCMI